MTIRRTAAFAALSRALLAASRDEPGLGRRLAALPRMIKATVLRRYDGLGRLILMVLALAYVVWPLELLPELLLGPLGLVEDTVVVAWLAGALVSETGRFLEWERRVTAATGTATGSEPEAEVSSTPT